MNAGTFPGAGSGLGGAAPRVVGMLVSPSASTVASSASSVITAMANCARAASSSLAAPVADVNVLSPILTVYGRGKINWASLQCGASSFNLRAVLEIDGVRIFDQSFGTTYTDAGFVLLGGGQGATAPANVVFQPIEFRSSLRILGGCTSTASSMIARYNAEIYE